MHFLLLYQTTYDQNMSVMEENMNVELTGMKIDRSRRKLIFVEKNQKLMDHILSLGGDVGVE